MKFEVWKKVSVGVDYVRIVVPVRYGDEDMPFDFPFRKDDNWDITVDIHSGKIHDWPEGVEYDLFMKVVDAGCYILLDYFDSVVSAITQNYVPHGVVPGEYGDYIHLDIGADGVIKNWPKDIDVSEFFPAP